MKTNNIGRTETMRIGEFIITITARLNDECKNGHEDFGLTYNMWEKVVSSRTWCGGGCAAKSTDQIVRKAIREFGLEPVERVHLSDMNGVPMYPTANAIYHAKNSGFDVFRDYLRLTDEEAKQAFYIDDELGLYVWLLDNGIIDRWKNEANEAIKAIINGRDIEFESTATKKQGHWYFKHDVTEEAIRAQRDLIRDGYYTQGRYNQHRDDETLNACMKSLTNSMECLQRRIDETEMDIKFKCVLRDIMCEHIAEFRKPLLVIDNSIFYQHRNEISFNWRQFSEKVNDEDYELIKKYLEPFCIENNLTISKKG